MKELDEIEAMLNYFAKQMITEGKDFPFMFVMLTPEKEMRTYIRYFEGTEDKNKFFMFMTQLCVLYEPIAYGAAFRAWVSKVLRDKKIQQPVDDPDREDGLVINVGNEDENRSIAYSISDKKLVDRQEMDGILKSRIQDIFRQGVEMAKTMPDFLRGVELKSKESIEKRLAEEIGLNQNEMRMGL